MKIRSAFVCIATVTAALAAQTAGPQAGSTPARVPAQVTDATTERALLNQYCVTCHNEKLKTAGLELDKLDTAHVDKHAEKWEKVVRKLRSGMMPPSGMPRPAWETYEAMVVVAGKRTRSQPDVALPAAGPASHESHRVRECDSRSAGAGDRSGQVPALGRFYARIRQHRGCIVAFARAAGRLYLGGGQNQPHRDGRCE